MLFLIDHIAMLMHWFRVQDIDECPIDSVKVLLDGSLYARVWVDRSRLVELKKERPGSMGGASGAGGIHAVRNMILTFAEFASIPQVRDFGVENLEAWLQNPSVKGRAKELLSNTSRSANRQAPTILLL